MRSKFLLSLIIFSSPTFWAADKHTPLNIKECTRTVLNSTGSKLEIKVHCEENKSSTDATLQLEAVSSDNVKGSMRSVTNTSGRTMNMNFTFSSRYLGPACGDVK